MSNRNTCTRCHKGIVKFEEVTAFDKPWHKSCFKCEGCKTVLLLTDISVEHDGMPYCNTCNLRIFSKGPVFKKPEPAFEWVDNSPSRPVATTVLNVESNKCTVCSKSVYKSEEILACGRVWHKSCFTCGGTANDGGCKRVCQFEKYLDHCGDPYCSPCYSRLFAEAERLVAGRGGLSAGAIGVTQRPVDLEKEAERLRELERKEALVRLEDADKCNVCDKPVYKYDEHKACDRIWHKNCFRCGSGSGGKGCDKLLSLSVFGEHGGDPFCIKCCQTKFGTRLECTDSGLREAPKGGDWEVKRLDPWGNEEPEENEEFWVDLASKAARDRVFKTEKIEIEGTTHERAVQLLQQTVTKRTPN